MCPDYVPYNEDLYNSFAELGFLPDKMCDLIADLGLSLGNYELYCIVAELRYFNANILKVEDYEERKRVWVEVHNYCKTYKIPFDVFCLWLLRRLKDDETPESKMILQEIKRKLRQIEFDYFFNKDIDVPEYGEWLSWKADFEDDEKDEEIYDQSYMDCSQYNDD
jgi:hypothetical protein